MSQLNTRLSAACDKDPAIVTPKSKLAEATGLPQDYLIELGMTKGDLLKLERAGLAIRAYSKNAWTAGDKLPNGKTVAEKELFHATGRQKVWILIGDDSNG